MTEERCRQLNRKVNGNPVLRNCVFFANRWLAWPVAAIYLAGLILVWTKGSKRELLLLILLPAAAFVLTTVLRRLIRKPRPYQTADIEPVTAGRSDSFAFPSRHVTSAFAIGAALLALGHPATGAAALVLGVLIAAARVLGGAHDPADVTAGAFIGILSGLLVYWIR